MAGALKGSFERGAFQSSPARGAIANSIARIVENSLRGEADVVTYLAAAMKCPLTTISEEPLRTLTLLFVEKMLVLEGAATQISAERFDGKPILFTDSAAKLKGQLKTVERNIGALQLPGY